MNSNARVAVVGKLESLFGQLKGSREPSGRFRNINKEGASFFLFDDAIDLLEEIVQTTLKQDDWSQKFSEKYIEGKITDILARALGTGSQASIPALFADLEQTLTSYSDEQLVLLPIIGVQLVEGSLEIGNIILRVVDDSYFSELIGKIDRIVRSSGGTEEEKRGFVNHVRGLMEQNIKGQLCAEYAVLAEPGRAQERAEVETRRVIDLIRFAIPALYSESDRVLVGLPGEVGRVPISTPILNKNEKSFNLQQSFGGGVFQFELRQRNLDHMRKIGCFKLSDLLRKKDQDVTEFERTVLDAVHWFANAQTIAENENRLINLIISLETVLTPNDGSPIAAYIAEAVALVLSSTVEGRKRLKRRLKVLYGLRSAVSHGGRKVVLDSQYLELQVIVGSFLSRMIERMLEFRTKGDLLDWIETIKFGGS